MFHGKKPITEIHRYLNPAHFLYSASFKQDKLAFYGLAYKTCVLAYKLFEVPVGPTSETQFGYFYIFV